MQEKRDPINEHEMLADNPEENEFEAAKQAAIEAINKMLEHPHVPESVKAQFLANCLAWSSCGENTCKVRRA